MKVLLKEENALERKGVIDIMYDGVINKPDLDEALEHYGVKGMKWRRRKNLVDKGYPSAESNKSYNLNLKTMQLTDDHYAKANKATDKSKPLTRAEKLRKKKKNLKKKWETTDLHSTTKIKTLNRHGFKDYNRTSMNRDQEFYFQNLRRKKK